MTNTILPPVKMHFLQLPVALRLCPQILCEPEPAILMPRRASLNINQTTQPNKATVILIPQYVDSAKRMLANQTRSISFC